MIKFENTVTPSSEQWKSIILGARNAMNSWAKSDSISCNYPEKCFAKCEKHQCEVGDHFYIGPNDLSLMMKLRNAGTDHRKFMRMIVVYVDILAPLYWWKEFDTYKVGTVANSCSTMHCIHKKEFDISDFSTEYLITGPDSPYEVMHDLVRILNVYRKLYLQTKDKKYWWQMIQLLPTSYNQKRTVMMNYEVLANIYESRKRHKLTEWSEGFMEWIKALPYSELITGEDYVDCSGQNWSLNGPRNLY